MGPIANKIFQSGGKQTRTFTFNRASSDRKARTVELSFSSETPVERSWGTEILDHGKKSVRLGRLRAGGPLLVDHDARDIVGVIESLRVDADLTGRAVVRFGKSARAEEVFQDVQDGIRRNASVAYVIYEAVEEKTKDSSLPTLRITDWEPYEISLVSVPADTAVGVGRDLRASSLTDKEQHMQDQLQAEKQRTNDILTIGREYNAAELAARAVQEGTSLADFQRQVLESRKASTIHFHNRSYGQDARSHDNLSGDPKLGFRNLGHFCDDVIKACRRNGVKSETLTRAASLFANEGAGPDGGYDVPPEFSGEIARVAYSETSLLGLANNMPVSGNSMSFPGDESTPWGSSGIIAKWEGEGDQADPKKPLLKHGELRLRKLRVLVAASDEVLEDASNLTAHLTDTMSEAVFWKTQDAIVNGTGSGMPLGILKAGSLVVQDKESGQANGTVVPQNIAKMLSRVIVGAKANLVWLMNRDVFPQIITLTLNNNPVWVQASGGFQNAPNGLLLGSPIVLTDACQGIGNKGDIVLANMRGYRAITKDGGPQLSTSMHLWFDQDIQAFKLVFRMDGGPQLSAPITPPYSTSTRSHFVALQAR
jgi:HK97 family phage major capsid protein/HK97 family phage prohead protease